MLRGILAVMFFLFAPNLLASGNDTSQQFMVSILGLENADLKKFSTGIWVNGYLARNTASLRLFLSRADALMNNDVHSIKLSTTYDWKLEIEKECVDSYVAVRGKLEFSDDYGVNLLVPDEIARFEFGQDDSNVKVCWRSSGSD